MSGPGACCACRSLLNVIASISGGRRRRRWLNSIDNGHFAAAVSVGVLLVGRRFDLAAAAAAPRSVPRLIRSPRHCTVDARRTDALPDRLGPVCLPMPLLTACRLVRYVSGISFLIHFVSFIRVILLPIHLFLHASSFH